MLCRLFFRTNTAFIIPYRMPYCVCHVLFLWPSVKKLAIKLKLQKMAFCSFRTKFFFSSNSTIFITANFMCFVARRKGFHFSAFVPDLNLRKCFDFAGSESLIQIANLLSNLGLMFNPYFTLVRCSRSVGEI